MIGAIDEAKAKSKPGQPAAPAGPAAGTEAKTDSKPATDSPVKAATEPSPKPGKVSQTKVEHAADTHES